MKIPFRIFLLFIGFAALAGCKKAYSPTVSTVNYNYLVVEGVVNSGSDSTFITLSRTVTLDAKTTKNPESQAIVTVESDQNGSYPLKETIKGMYASKGLNLDVTRKYRLRITTINSKVYLSDYVSVVNSPPIDSINYVPAGGNLDIYSNTHDPQNNTHYYRWDYKETWIFHSNYQSLFKSNGDTVLARDLVNDEIYTCWGNDTSSTIILGSSAKLKSDVIFENPLIAIPSSSEKIGIEYSIIVRQYALTADAYNFYTNIKKNTEQLGSIFDAQPSQLNSNIHSVTNPSEPVIGYLSVGSVASQRIFIHKQQLPSWTTTPAVSGCQLVRVCFFCVVAPIPGVKIAPEPYEDEEINYNHFNHVALIPTDSLTGIPAGHFASTPLCVDCTLRGTNKQPPFWVY